MKDHLILDEQPLNLETVEAVARHGLRVSLSDSARASIQSNRQVVEAHLESGCAIYGVNTGFGSLSRHRIDPPGIRDVQRNLLRSHAAGVGDPLDGEVVRAMMLILAASLSRAKSGVRVAVVEQILHLLNNNIIPVVPSRGSVGASGDLAPLAHAGLVLIGEGEATVNGKVMPGDDALQSAGLTPITLEAKEGLALINGTHLMTAIGTLALCDIQRIGDAALCAAAIAIDACRGTDAALDERIHTARCQTGQQRVAAALRQLLHGSTIITSHRDNDPRVQDPYCLRAAPQVIGAAFDTIDFVRGVFERELGAVTDNPLVFSEQNHRGAHGDRGEEQIDSSSMPSSASSALSAVNWIVSGANFHGMPLAIALDILPIALTHIAGIAERRVNWLLTASDSENPVNVYLSPQPGLHSGLMIAQYTAAACVNELQTLSNPASVGNIPTSAGIEDYNSMGATAAHKARAAVDLLRNVIAIELLVMTEAMEYQRPLRSGDGVERTYETVRNAVPRLTEDRPPAPDIAAIAGLITDGAFAFMR